MSSQSNIEKYRKEVERFAKRGEGKLSVFARKLLNTKRDELRLSEEEAKPIEDEVLQDFREYERKLNEYEQALIEAVKDNYPFSESIEADLKEYETHLALRDEDISAIKAKVIPQIFYFEMVTIVKIVKKDEKVTHEIKRSRKQAQFFTEYLENGEILEMVAIPGGTFLMGSPTEEPQRRNSEGPEHSVMIKPFLMGKFPVTRSQWQTVAGFPKVKIDLNPKPSDFKDINRPVEQISWYEAVEFCDRLSQKTGRNYRLPSEAEWEYACRAGTITSFHFGETITTDLANYNGDYAYASGFEGIYRRQTTEVGSFPANAFGLYDMHGNVWEWCADHWHDNYEGAPNDGSIWLSNDENSRKLVRGGSWNDGPGFCRSAYRDINGSAYSNGSFGFRIVCSAPWA
jgi:formylglycine-generating enzyme required for sulfatase activity